jgi:hypothetical protein
MRHPPAYPPPGQYYYNAPPPRAEHTPPQSKGSFNNDDSPSGLAVNTLLMAAYAMTELDEKKEGEKKEENAPMPNGASKVKEERKGENAPMPNGAATASKEPEESHAFGSTSETKAPADNNPGSLPKESEPTEQDTPETSTPSQPSANPQDTSTPPIEERLSAEVSPDNKADETRKRPHSTMEDEEAPSSFNPPPRPEKVELFRREIPLPESVSADSEEGKGEEPPMKKRAVDPVQ